MKLSRNLHLLDQLLRLPVAAACLYLGFIDPSHIDDTLLALAVGLFGVLNLVAGLSGFCPVYRLAGLSTCPRSRGKATS